ncbi:hypothetical protein KEH51_04835 [[Brevibacterium] frigoritolerans]|uniref:Uncharacterized protein n=1 Tax=Peribacillus frigoritolerans TaxID=450367 RepID=A0A941FPP9_9BACI|nr:hypothetical protein [Peribacillus frigoritolerans]
MKNLFLGGVCYGGDEGPGEEQENSQVNNEFLLEALKTENLDQFPYGVPRNASL